MTATSDQGQPLNISAGFSVPMAAAAIRAGTVWVNMLPILDVAAPWGGFKASGWGREFSHQALDAFTETKSIFIGFGLS